MNIAVSKRSYAQCVLTITEGATTIVEDVATFKRGDSGFAVPEDQIAQLLNAAYALNEFNGDEVFLAVAAKLVYGDDWKRKLAQALEAE